MRYLVGFLCVCALGVVPLVGCGEEVPPECEIDEECDDQNQCTIDGCAGGTCKYTWAAFRTYCDDGDDWECSEGWGECVDGACRMRGATGTECTFDGVTGVCVYGVCGEDRCAGVDCDDGNECTEDICRFRDGSCRYVDLDTTECTFAGGAGVCVYGVCRQDHCWGVICNDGDPCTDDKCAYYSGRCYHYTKCSDPNVCVDSWCDPVDGSCVYTPVSGRRCNAGLFCSDGVCVNGSCDCW